MSMDFSAYLFEVDSQDKTEINHNEIYDIIKYTELGIAKYERTADHQENSQTHLTETGNRKNQSDEVDSMKGNKQDLNRSAWRDSIMFTTNIKQWKTRENVPESIVSLSFENYSHLAAPGSRPARPVRNNHSDAALVCKQKGGMQMRMLSTIWHNTTRMHGCQHCKTTANGLSSGSKKMTRKVTFSDAIGIPLRTIRVFESKPEDQFPSYIAVVADGSVPPTALQCDKPMVSTNKHLTVTFAQPISNFTAFFKKVDKCKVSLENIMIKGNEFLGMVRVRNIAFEKDIFVRYTSNYWHSYNDNDTTHVPNEDSAIHDTFTFQISVDPAGTPDVEFAICYKVQGQEFWDNNQGQNFKLIFA